MKLFIEQSDEYGETEIHIKCGIIDENLQKVIDELQIMMFSISGIKDGATHKIPLKDIYYFESVDDRTFIFCEHDVFECKLKLYEIEKRIEEQSFSRISKSVIVNITKIKSIRPKIEGRFEALLLNGERQIINRHYVNDLRRKFEGGLNR